MSFAMFELERGIREQARRREEVVEAGELALGNVLALGGKLLLDSFSSLRRPMKHSTHAGFEWEKTWRSSPDSSSPFDSPACSVSPQWIL